MKPIILVGYMGSGKSTVGKQLAKKLQYSFVDTDSKIEEKEKITIKEMFATKGEDYFRDCETELLQSFLLDQAENVILSTGGGMPMRAQNAILMQTLGTVFYLKASPDTIYARVKHDTTRPLLQCADPLAKIQEMIQQRGPKYENVADFCVEVDGKDVSQIVNEIVSHLS